MTLNLGYVGVWITCNHCRGLITYLRVRDIYDNMKTLIKKLLRENLIEYKNLKVLGKEIIPKEFVYHQSSIENRESILKTGLVPSVGECYYLYSRGGDIKNREDCIPAIFATNSSDRYDLYTEDNVDLWQINTKIIPNKWYKDGNFPDLDIRNIEIKHILTLDKINPNALKLVTQTH